MTYKDIQMVIVHRDGYVEDEAECRAIIYAINTNNIRWGYEIIVEKDRKGRMIARSNMVPVKKEGE